MSSFVFTLRDKDPNSYFVMCGVWIYSWIPYIL